MYNITPTGLILSHFVSLRSMRNSELLVLILILLIVTVCLYIRYRHHYIASEARTLWMDHLYLTREFIIETTTAYKGTSLILARLLRNQDDLGDNWARIHGKDNGSKYAELLKKHIAIAGGIVDMTIHKQDPTPLITEWQKNADEISEFLASCNSRIDVSMMKQHMRGHLDTTLKEAVSIISSDFKGSVENFDSAREHVLKMVDYLEATM